MTADSRRSLDQVQRWFQTVVTHPDGVTEGAASDPAQSLIPLSRNELEAVIRPSSRLSAERRLSIYAHAYYARLIECLGESFPVVRRTLGPELFEPFAFEYVQHHPSRSYTLDRLGDHFARFVADTRPLSADGAAAGSEWPEFLADLATLEWEIAQVFDGEGVEGRPPAELETLRQCTPEAFASMRLAPVVCLRLLELRFPVNDFYTASRRALRDDEDQEIAIPKAGTEWLALSRKDWIVRRYPLSRSQFVLLGSLRAGATVGEAIAAAARCGEMDIEALQGRIGGWFEEWGAEGLFEWPDAGSSASPGQVPRPPSP